MFDGVPSDQFHQFIAAAAAAAAAASSTTSQLQSPPLSFPLHVSSSTFPSFDLYSSNSGGGGGGGQQHLQVPHLVHPLHHHSSSSSLAPVPQKDDQDKEGSSLVSINLEGQRERSMLDLIDPWSNDEVVALLRIRSTMENWFPDFTWEHVSRSLHSLYPPPFSLSLSFSLLLSLSLSLSLSLYIYIYIYMHTHSIYHELLLSLLLSIEYKMKVSRVFVSLSIYSSLSLSPYMIISVCLT